MIRRDVSDLVARTGRSPESVDRILVGVCALIWLILLGVSVAAVVALVDLGQGFHQSTQNAHSGLLYIVIGVSALIILAAVPMLMRARRFTPAPPTRRPVVRPAGPVGGPPLRAARRAAESGVGGRRADSAVAHSGLSSSDVDRVWLRGTAELASVMGAALIAVAAATYLMAVGKDAVSWAGYGVAGVALAVMPAVPWRHLRQLRDRLVGPGQLY